MNKSIVVYGPQGCGKSKNAKAFMKFFGLNCLFDGHPIELGYPKFDTLVLTNHHPSTLQKWNRRVIEFDKAMAMMNAPIDSNGMRRFWFIPFSFLGKKSKPQRIDTVKMSTAIVEMATVLNTIKMSNMKANGLNKDKDVLSRLTHGAVIPALDKWNLVKDDFFKTVEGLK